MITISLRIFTDSSANLPEQVLRERDIQAVSLTLSVNGGEMLCYDPDHPFDGEAFYAHMRADDKLVLHTSMINETAFAAAFEPCLAAGDDVIFIAMSSGISGTYHAGETAAQRMREKYGDRRIRTVDTHAASLGEGLMVIEAADMRDKHASVDEIADFLLLRRENMHQHFMVGDLLYLKRGGRISASVALAGNLLSLKPILKADEEGRIVLDRKIIGRKKALRTLEEIFDEHYHPLPENAHAGIAHGACEADAKALADTIRQKHPEVNFTIVCYEPGTGAHVGPDTVALFFWGAEQEERAALLTGVRAKIASEAANLKTELEHKLHKEKE